ncbi:MAG: hypothetical protein EZS28_023158, partial [Streblomastix strix]
MRDPNCLRFLFLWMKSCLRTHKDAFKAQKGLCPLCYKSDNIEESKVASDALSKIIRNSPNIRESLIKSGFVEMSRFNLTDENTPDHIHTNILIVIQDL